MRYLLFFNLSEEHTQKEVKDFVYYTDIEFKFLQEINQVLSFLKIYQTR
jgi:hypothetical protein